MKYRTVQSDFLLLLTAAIWGFAFVAQRAGMDYVGPFTFNAVRFTLGTLFLVPFLLVQINKNKAKSAKPKTTFKQFFFGAFLAGIALYLGSTFQQIGVVYTTAGNAGFITGLYVVLVPILGLAIRHRARFGTWIGVMLAVIGMYLLSVKENFTISPGDLLVLISAFFWASHVLIIDWLAPRIDSLKIAVFQFTTCAVLSYISAFIFEDMQISSILDATIPILYAGLMSVGIAYTLQIVAQKNAHPAHAAIILSLESVFAVLGGWLILHEIMSLRSLIGCGFMLVGMIVSQVANWSIGNGQKSSKK